MVIASCLGFSEKQRVCALKRKKENGDILRLRLT